MQSIITADEYDLTELAKTNDPICVTLYAPVTHGSHARENKPRIRNLLSIAEGRMERRGAPRELAEQWIASARQTVEETGFLDVECRGLALFLSESLASVARLPHLVAEGAFVGKHFEIIPLLPFALDRDFWLLELGEDHVRLSRGSRWQAREVYSAEKSAEDPDHQRVLQAHDGVHLGRQRHTVITGQGGKADRIKPEAIVYLRQAAEELHPFLRESQDPLVIAAVESTAALFRQISQYPAIYPEIIHGNPRDRSKFDLHRAAWSLIEATAEEETARVTEQWVEQSRRDPLATDLPEVLRRAVAGTVEEVVVAANQARWGTYDEHSDRFELLAEHDDQAEDILNLAAAHTLWHGGRAVSQDLEALGIHASLVAKFRNDAGSY